MRISTENRSRMICVSKSRFSRRRLSAKPIKISSSSKLSRNKKSVNRDARLKNMGAKRTSLINSRKTERSRSSTTSNKLARDSSSVRLKSFAI